MISLPQGPKHDHTHTYLNLHTHMLTLTRAYIHTQTFPHLFIRAHTHSHASSQSHMLTFALTQGFTGAYTCTQIPQEGKNRMNDYSRGRKDRWEPKPRPKPRVLVGRLLAPYFPTPDMSFMPMSINFQILPIYKDPCQRGFPVLTHYALETVSTTKTSLGSHVSSNRSSGFS